jgi:hypothetical protein
MYLAGSYWPVPRLCGLGTNWPLHVWTLLMVALCAHAALSANAMAYLALHMTGLASVCGVVGHTACSGPHPSCTRSARSTAAMARVTQLVGAILVVVGVVAYVATGFASVTALLPSLLGLVLGLLGLAAARIDAGQHAIHAALVIALLGLLGSLRPLGGLADADPAAITSLVAVLVLVVYLALGVRAFVIARRAR